MYYLNISLKVGKTKKVQVCNPSYTSYHNRTKAVPSSLTSRQVIAGMFVVMYENFFKSLFI